MAYTPSAYKLPTVTTTNATPDNTSLVALATSGQTAWIICDFYATSGNNRSVIRKAALVKNLSGTLTIVGGTITDVIPLITDVALAAAAPTIGVSGTNIVLSCVGIAATTITWTIIYSINIY